MRYLRHIIFYVKTKILTDFYIGISLPLKSVISSIVNENQVAYVNNRFISESGGLISHVLEIANSLDIEGLLLMAVDREKAFDSINHSFLMCVC